MEEVTNKIETMILLSLDATQSNVDHGKTRRSRAKGNEIAVDTGELVVRDTMNITSAFTADMGAGERIYTNTPSGLLAHPSDVVGDESEVMLLWQDKLAWVGFRRVIKAPRGISYLGKPSCFYEKHYRIVNGDGSGDYAKHFLAINRDGAFVPTFYQGNPTSTSLDAGHLCLAASIIEDAHRANAMLAQVKDATEIKFPVPLGDYKDIFADRDGPMNGARRKSILHWVARHLRTSTRGNAHDVKMHTRGIQEFTIDGLRVRLTPNALANAPASTGD